MASKGIDVEYLPTEDEARAQAARMVTYLGHFAKADGYGDEAWTFTASDTGRLLGWLAAPGVRVRVLVAEWSRPDAAGRTRVARVGFEAAAPAGLESWAQGAAPSGTVQGGTPAPEVVRAIYRRVVTPGRTYYAQVQEREARAALRIAKREAATAAVRAAIPGMAWDTTNDEGASTHCSGRSIRISPVGPFADGTPEIKLEIAGLTVEEAKALVAEWWAAMGRALDAAAGR